MSSTGKRDHISRMMLPANDGLPEDGGAAMALQFGDGGGTLGGMNDRLTALETHFGYVRKDLDSLAAGQKDIHSALTEVSKGLTNVGSRIDVQAAEARTQSAEFRVQLASLPTKASLWGMIATVVSVGLAISALTFVIADWVKTTQAI